MFMRMENPPLKQTLVFSTSKYIKFPNQIPSPKPPAGVDPHLPKITYAMALRLDEPPKALPLG